MTTLDTGVSDTLPGLAPDPAWLRSAGVQAGARLRRAWSWLPEGRALPPRTWERRHRAIVRFALFQALGVGLFGLLRHFSPVVCATDTMLVAAPAVLACYRPASQGVRTISATVSLMFASATIVDLANGSDVAHFHFFVMLGIVALYQDWMAFGVCIIITVLHHAVLGTIDPKVVYGDTAEARNPIVWAFIHGGFILASSITYLIAWKTNEQQELSDAMTRLPNRTAFVRTLTQLLSDPGNLVSVLYIDIDNFKQINDSAGHQAGDEVLRYVGERMHGVIREGDALARLGGDEFAICVRGGAGTAAAVASRLLLSLEEPIHFDQRELLVHASIGIADTELARSRQAGDLIRDADLAMYLAKSSGGTRVVTYTAGVDQAVRQRAQLASDLRSALAAGQFELQYQPVVSGMEGKLSGVEVLIRWNHPERGLVMPMDFITLAEETGDIRDIGAWVLCTAAAQVVDWQHSIPGCAELHLSVNLSTVQLRDENLVELVSSALTATGLAPEHLTLEVTESMLLTDLATARRQLNELRQMGVRVAIDDFGTGYSSLSYLSRLPADIIKIDRSFVQDLEANSGSSVLTKAIVTMANGLKLETVAEGVENIGQQHTLNELGCHFSQGFLYSPAIPVQNFARFVAEWPGQWNAIEERLVHPVDVAAT
jgi:diguanylate cyclase (GGDEF)-like protein